MHLAAPGGALEGECGLPLPAHEPGVEVDRPLLDAVALGLYYTTLYHTILYHTIYHILYTTYYIL